MIYPTPLCLGVPSEQAYDSHLHYMHPQNLAGLRGGNALAFEGIGRLRGKEAESKLYSLGPKDTLNSLKKKNRGLGEILISALSTEIKVFLLTGDPSQLTLGSLFRNSPATCITTNTNAPAQPLLLSPCFISLFCYNRLGCILSLPASQVSFCKRTSRIGMKFSKYFRKLFCLCDSLINKFRFSKKKKKTRNQQNLWYLIKVRHSKSPTNNFQ